MVPRINEDLPPAFEQASTSAEAPTSHGNEAAHSRHTPPHSPPPIYENHQENNNTNPFQPTRSTKSIPAAPKEPQAQTHLGPRQHGLALNAILGRYTEWPWEYLPGGHHPVHLGDVLSCEDRSYKVLHKLGAGGFGNVWLCRVCGIHTDTDISVKQGENKPRYLAVKILKAEVSGDDCREVHSALMLMQKARLDPEINDWCLLPDDVFTLTGPNGTHQCFAYEVAAAGIEDMSRAVDDVDGFLRGLARQTAMAMGVLHRNEIVHGDFRPSNILFRLSGLNGLPEEEVMELLGIPNGAEVVVYEDVDPHAHPPRYILNPVDFNAEILGRLGTSRIWITDFGEAFVEGEPPAHGSGIPYRYAAPEVALDHWAGKESDVFALAATMYEVRFGRKLFAMQYDADTVEAGGMCGGRVTDPADEDTLEGEETVKRWHLRKAVCVRVAHRIKTVHDWDDLAVGCADSHSVESAVRPEWHEAIPKKEKVLFADLLYRMTALHPRDRYTIQEVLDHPWFQYRVAQTYVPRRDDRVHGNDNGPLPEPVGTLVSNKQDSQAQEVDEIEAHLQKALVVDEPDALDFTPLQTAEEVVILHSDDSTLVIEEPQLAVADLSETALPQPVDDTAGQAITLDVLTPTPRAGANSPCSAVNKRLSRLSTDANVPFFVSAVQSLVVDGNESYHTATLGLDLDDLHSLRAVKSIPSPRWPLLDEPLLEERPSSRLGDSELPLMSGALTLGLSEKGRRRRRRGKKQGTRSKVVSVVRSVGRAFRSVFA
ncbi:kinase-like domain-containing protein [Aspergillus multicolor]|uniref:kinase-like domain-containing protein n=1 Tax=Aspergillus multicolor TaxID=41759 RepID=UPI003CCD3CE2